MRLQLSSTLLASYYVQCQDPWQWHSQTTPPAVIACNPSVQVSEDTGSAMWMFCLPKGTAIKVGKHCHFDAYTSVGAAEQMTA